MEEQITHFTEQFAWEPEIIHSEYLAEHPSHFIVCGMGGSHLATRLLLRHDPTLNLSIHSDYGLPREPIGRLHSALIVASSYSGETEETLDSAEKAIDAGLSVAVITTGGALAKFAEKHALPLILIPKQNVEPRMAVGAGMLALAKLMKTPDLEAEIRKVGMGIEVEKGRVEGETLAKRLNHSIPLIYSSTLDMPLAYFWKIAFNETGKIPAFYNVFPEVCHNELSGFDSSESARPLSTNFHILLLNDSDNYPRIDKRMHVMQGLLAGRGIGVTNVELVGSNSIEKALYGILAGVWTALALAKEYQAPDSATPLIADFKRIMLES